MKNYSLKPKRLFGNLSVSLLLISTLLLTTSCETEEFDTISENEAINKEDAVQKVAPVSGKTYYLKNRNSGLHLDVQNKSNSNGANVQQWGDGSGTHRQWQVISVGNGYYRLRGVDSGKSLTVKNGSNANGTNIEIRSYSAGTTHQEWDIKSTSNGYYRLKSRDSGKSMGVVGGSQSNGANVESRSWNGNSKFEWLFIEVGGGTTPPVTPPNTGGGDTPGAAIGLTSSNWKLNGFTGSGSGATYQDDLLKSLGKTFNNYSDNTYFYTDGEWAFFKCYRGLGGSKNSNNPRVELREMRNGSLANWNGNSGTHTMEWTVRVDQLPKSTSGNDGVVCFGQIHGPEKNSAGEEIDDAIRVQFIGSPNQTSGSVKLKISGYVTEEQGGSQTFDNGYKLDTSYKFKIVYAAKFISVYVNGNRVFNKKMDVRSWNGNYFKVGNYLQSVKGASYDRNSFGIVRVKDLSISHN